MLNLPTSRMAIDALSGECEQLTNRHSVAPHSRWAAAERKAAKALIEEIFSGLEERIKAAMKAGHQQLLLCSSIDARSRGVSFDFIGDCLEQKLRNEGVDPDLYRLVWSPTEWWIDSIWLSWLLDWSDPASIVESKVG